MAEAYTTTPRSAVEDSPAEGREHRRHRAHMMRRLAAVQSASGVDLQPVDTSEPLLEPVFGMMSVFGRRRDLEDEVSTITWLIGQERLLHCFAIFDGHGGPHVSSLCGEKMHEIVLEELAHVLSTRSVAEGDAWAASLAEEETWSTVMGRSFERIDEVALNTCACGIAGGGECECAIGLGGSTAVVAVVTQHHIVVANCGDSRAVLSRGGAAVLLSDDHKPDRADELERIENAGGRVIFGDRARVEGIIATSRAIGVKNLKSFVISEPEITFTRRESNDECLILGSDGLWDVVSSEIACMVAQKCLQGEDVDASIARMNLNALPEIEEVGAGTVLSSQSALAAALLTRLALGQKSPDNISVIVVDLNRT